MNEVQLGLDFRGATYDPSRDCARLNKQMADVWLYVGNGEWWTLSLLEKVTGHPQASISARLRDMRRDDFHRRIGRVVEVEHQFVKRGLWKYRAVIGEKR